MATESCWRPTTARPTGLSRTSRIWSNGKLRSRRRQLLSVKRKIAARNKLKPADREKSGQPEKIQHRARGQEGGGVSESRRRPPSYLNVVSCREFFLAV